MRASVAAETVGIPTVSLVCEGFEGQATATGRGLGFDALRLALLAGHVDAQSSDEMIESFLATTVDQIVAGLTNALDDDQPTISNVVEPASLDIVASGPIGDVFADFARRGWCDGLPFVPPTQPAVEAFIAPSGHDPWRVIGIARPSGRDITVWCVAVNGLMAGCSPEHLPVLLAVAEILAGDHYGVEHSGNTTGADALMIIDGPSMDDLGFNSGQGVLREGTRANTTVGRWLRLFLRNVCGFTADQHDKATFGNSMKMVLGEDRGCLEEIGWPSVAEDAGFDHDDDVVTMARMNSGAMIGSVFGSTATEILPYLADGLVRITGWDLTHVFGLGQGHYRPLLILSPNLARTFGRSGWSREEVQAALFETARMPAWRFEKLIGEWSNLSTGRRTLVDMVEAGDVPESFAETHDSHRLVPIVTSPDKFVIAVAGDPSRANAYVMSNDGPHGYWTSRRFDTARSRDLDCAIP